MRGGETRIGEGMEEVTPVSMRKLASFPSMVRITQGSWAEMSVKLEPRKDALGPFGLVDEQSETGIFQEPLPSGDTLPFNGLPCKWDRVWESFSVSKGNIS